MNFVFPSEQEQRAIVEKDLPLGDLITPAVSQQALFLLTSITHKLLPAPTRDLINVTAPCEQKRVNGEKWNGVFDERTKLIRRNECRCTKKSQPQLLRSTTQQLTSSELISTHLLLANNQRFPAPPSEFSNLDCFPKG